MLTKTKKKEKKMIKKKPKREQPAEVLLRRLERVEKIRIQRVC
jgi:hypothetical protein